MNVGGRPSRHSGRWHSANHWHLLPFAREPAGKQGVEALRLTLPHASLLTLAIPSPQMPDNNCCHLVKVNQVLLGAGSAGVESYFPEYSMPSWEPRD